MPRTARMVIPNEQAVYHVMSHTALDGYPIKSGEKENIVPGYCKLIINRRIIPDENYKQVKQEILEVIEKGKAQSKALEIKTSFKYDNPSFNSWSIRVYL